MFRKDQFGIVFNTIFALVFAIVLPIYIDSTNMLRMTGSIQMIPLLQTISKDFIIGFAISFTIGTYIDLKAMGDAFARLLGLKNEKSLPFHLVRLLCIVFVMVFIMSLSMMFISAGYTMPAGAFFMAYLMSFPLTFVVAYIVAFITFGFGLPLTMALCTKPPDHGAVH